MPPQRLLVAGALGAALANLAFAKLATGVESAILWRMLTGSGVAAIYMPGVKIIAQRLPLARRGRAMGLFVASFTIGSATSVSLSGSLAAWLGWRAALGLMSLGPFLGALAGWRVARHPAPNILPQDGEVETSGSAWELLHNRDALLVIATYSAHVWELFGLRTWLPAFMTAVFLYGGAELTAATRQGANVAGLATLLGALSIVLAATASDRFGRTPTIRVISGLGFLSTIFLGFMRTWSQALVIPAALVTTFLATADSAVISTALTETVPQAYLGRALAVYSFSGFLAGSLSPLLFGAVQDRTGESWRWAFAALALGGLTALGGATLLRRRARAGRSVLTL
jgi:MFS family permease